MSNSTDSNSTDCEPVPKVAYAAVYGCIMILGLPLNAVSLWVLLRRHSLKTPTAVLMVNLALSDLLLVITLPLRVYFYATGKWELDPMVCQVTTIFFRNNIRSSCIFITFISVDRLLAVVYPLRSRHLRTSSNAWKAVLIAWVSVVVVNIPDSVTFAKFLKRNNESVCFEFHMRDTSSVAYFQPVLVFVMLTVNVVCTALVSWTLRRHLSESAKVNNKVNVMLIFIMNLIVFTICFVPGSVSPHINRKTTPLTCLACFNCCLDPLLYYFSLDSFWKKKEDAEQ